MKRIDIQRAAPEQGAALCVLLRDAYRAYADRGLNLPDVTEGLDAEIAAGRVWVAIRDGRLLGMLNLSLDRPTAHLVNVAVSPEAKGQGVGSALIRFAIREAIKVGCSSVDLATHSELAENIKLYQHLGWSVTGREETRVFMSLPLKRVD